MPIHLRQHQNRLHDYCSNCTDEGHIGLRHHHAAMICHRGRCLSLGRNYKYCILRASHERKSCLEERTDRRQQQKGEKNYARRSKRYRERSKRFKTPPRHQLPIKCPVQFKAKLLHYGKTMRKL